MRFPDHPAKDRADPVVQESRGANPGSLSDAKQLNQGVRATSVPGPAGSQGKQR